MNLHQNKPPTWLVHIPGHPLDHETHHGPDSGEATTFPHIVFSAPRFGDYIQMALFPGTPKLESRNCPVIVPVGVPRLWELITPDCGVWSRRGLNQSCSPRRDLFNILHSQFEGREEVDSRLLVVGSQTASLTPSPSFAHNLGDKCPNGQCEAIFDIYASRPFQWHQEHLNARCFGPCCRTLNIRESRRTPNPQLWKCWASPPHLAKVGLRHAITHNNDVVWFMSWTPPSLTSLMISLCHPFKQMFFLWRSMNLKVGCDLSLFPHWARYHPISKVHTYQQPMVFQNDLHWLLHH